MSGVSCVLYLHCLYRIIRASYVRSVISVPIPTRKEKKTEKPVNPTTSDVCSTPQTTDSIGFPQARLSRIVVSYDIDRFFNYIYNIVQTQRVMIYSYIVIVGFFFLFFHVTSPAIDSSTLRSLVRSRVYETRV